MRRALLALFLLLPGALAAQEGCRAIVNGTEVVIAPDSVATDGPGLTERLLGWPSRTWDRAWGTPPDCDSATLLAFLAGLEGFDPAETAGYCLAPLPDSEEFLLVPGERGLTGRCSRTACDRVNMAAADAAVVAGALAQLVTGEEIDGLSSAAHASGAYLLSGSSTLLAPVLEGLAEGVGAGLAANPAVAGATVATALVAGGVLYYCAD